MKNANNQLFGDLLSTLAKKQRYFENFESRKVIPSKFLNWNYFEEKNMAFIDTLKNFGLKNFVRYKRYWSVEVVRAFYTNLEYKVRERI